MLRIHLRNLLKISNRMASPSKLDRLHRFFRHEEEANHTCSWNVSAGSLERRQRLYRIFYESPDYCTQQEITIDVKKPELLKEYFLYIVGILKQPAVDPDFLKACKDLLAEDPCLSMFQLSPPTNIHQLPYIYDAGVLLMSDGRYVS